MERAEVVPEGLHRFQKLRSLPFPVTKRLVFVGDRAVDLRADPELFGHPSSPSGDTLATRNVVERGVPLHGGHPLGIQVQKLVGGRTFGVEVPDPPVVGP
jgi:hypothetical protein